MSDSAVRITLAGGAGHVDADYNAVPGCLDPKRPSTIEVSPWESAKVKPCSRRSFKMSRCAVSSRYGS